MAAVTTSTALAEVHAGGAGAVAGAGGAGARTARRKQRCWVFQVDGVTSNATEVELLASIRERYTTVKRLAVRTVPVNSRVEDSTRNVIVEVQFTGPQPSEGPGALLCDLLRGISVEAQPVELPRGRKKRPRTDAGASVEGSDSDAEDAGSRKMGGVYHRSTNSLGRTEDEDEEQSAVGGQCIQCITAKPSCSSQGGSAMGGGTPQDPQPNFRRTSSQGSEGAVIPSADLGAVSPAGVFESPSSSDGQTAVYRRVVVPADDGIGEAATALHGVTPPLPPQQQRVVSSDALSPPAQQSFSRPAVGVTGTGNQWDDVVRRMTSPQNSGHSLEMGSDHSSHGSSQPPVKSECERLITNSAGTWNSNDSQVALLGPMPPLLLTKLSSRAWSFDSAQVADIEAGAGSNMVVDLSDVEGLLRGSAKGDAASAASAAVARPGSPTGAAANSSTSSPMSRSSSADAGAGRMVHEAMPSSKWSDGGHLPMEKVIIEPSKNECDFEGRPNPAAKPTSGQTVIPASTDRQCHLVFTGLNQTGQDLSSLRVTAHFGVDSVHKVGKVTSPIQLLPNGRAYAGLYYPSMQEIWPELYSTGNIRVVEVDVIVEIRSDSGEYQYVGPQLKVSYLRSESPAEASEAPRRQQGRQTASRAPIPFNNDPQVSYSCVDYSCGDWFSDMCQSVFRSGAIAHQPLRDDPEGLMSVDP